MIPKKAAPNSAQSKLVPMAFMLGGGFGILFGVISLNQLTTSNDKDDIKKIIQMDIKKPQTKKKVVRHQKKIRKKKKPAKKLAPPNLDSLLKGASFGLSSYEVDMSSLSDSLLGDTGDTVMNEDTVDQLPRVQSRQTITYPSDARKKGLTGEVVLKLLIAANGQIEKVKVTDSYPDGVFDQAAMDSVKTWAFHPAMYRGRPVRVWVKQRLKFELN